MYIIVQGVIIMVDRDEAIALAISFFLPGLGIAYAEDVKKGVTIFVSAIICNLLSIFFGLIFSIIAFLIWAYGMYATYMYFQ